MKASCKLFLSAEASRLVKCFDEILKLAVVPYFPLLLIFVSLNPKWKSVNQQRKPFNLEINGGAKVDG